MLIRRGLYVVPALVLLSGAIPATTHASILPPLDPGRVAQYNVIGGPGEMPRAASFAASTYDSNDPGSWGTPPNPLGYFVSGGPGFTFELPKFDKQGLAQAIQWPAESIRLEEAIFDLGITVFDGYNIFDNESKLVYNGAFVSIAVTVEAHSTATAQSVEFLLDASKTKTGDVQPDDPAEQGQEVTVFGVTYNSDFVGDDTLEVRFDTETVVDDQVTLEADHTRPDGDDVLADFIGPDTLLWEVSSQKLADASTHLEGLYQNKSPDFHIESRAIYIYSVAIPEPATAVLLLAGLAGIVAKRRRGKLS